MEQIWTTSIGKQQGIDLLNAHAQWYCNDIEPATTYPFQNWADTGNDLWKQRNADNNGWIVRGRLSEAYFGLAQQSMVESMIESMIESINENMIAIVDPLGHPKEYYGTTLPPRHLWVDGKTIGDAQSGATARANSDVYNLFAVLWDSVNNTNSQIKIYDSLGVLTGKGESAAADFAAHKAISLPDMRGRTPIGLDNMGGISADRVTNEQADILGGSGGEEKHALTAEENGPHVHDIKIGTGLKSNQPIQMRMDQFESFQAISGCIYSSGNGTPHNNMQPWIACNWIMRY